MRVRVIPQPAKVRQHRGRPSHRMMERETHPRPTSHTPILGLCGEDAAPRAPTHQRSYGMLTPWTAGEDQAILAVSRIQRSRRPDPPES